MPQPRGYRYTHCRWGHEFDEANTYVRPSDGRRLCRKCRAVRAREYRRRKRICPECGGLGHSVEAVGAPCQTCLGTGRREAPPK